MIYTGIKVKLKNENSVHGSLLRFYQDKGYLYVSHIFENNNIWLSDTPHGGINISSNRELIIPIYDENILTVLKNKREEFYMLDREIRDIEEFINNKCKD